MNECLVVVSELIFPEMGRQVILNIGYWCEGTSFGHPKHLHHNWVHCAPLVSLGSYKSRIEWQTGHESHIPKVLTLLPERSEVKPAVRILCSPLACLKEVSGQCSDTKRSAGALPWVYVLQLVQVMIIVVFERIARTWLKWVSGGVKLVLYLQVTGSMRRTGMLNSTRYQYYKGPVQMTTHCKAWTYKICHILDQAL
jgi:hypothetical protein